MQFLPTSLPDVYLVELSPQGDERGRFLRTYCGLEFERRGMVSRFEQCNMVSNLRTGTLRGMHYQIAPCAETKLIHCLRGSMFDVVLDLRPSSETRGRWQSFELSSESPRLLYVPAGCAHGYQTLEPDTCVYYQMSAPYSRDHERGLRWNDPLFAIDWPLPDPILSHKDRAYADFEWQYANSAVEESPGARAGWGSTSEPRADHSHP